jgi:hypothetical protein
MPDEMPAHRPVQMSRLQTEEIGPITRQNLSSANKRVRPVGSDE